MLIIRGTLYSVRGMAPPYNHGTSLQRVGGDRRVYTVQMEAICAALHDSIKNVRFPNCSRDRDVQTWSYVSTSMFF